MNTSMPDIASTKALKLCRFGRQLTIHAYKKTAVFLGFKFAGLKTVETNSNDLKCQFSIATQV